MRAPITESVKYRSSRLDERLSRFVREAIRNAGYLPLRNVSVVAHEGHVVLHGRLPTWYMKQLAQCAAMSVPGVESLSNEIVVL